MFNGECQIPVYHQYIVLSTSRFKHKHHNIDDTVLYRIASKSFDHQLQQEVCLKTSIEMKGRFYDLTS